MFEVVKELIVKQLGKDPNAIKMDTKLANELGIDSIDAMELISAIEEKFDIYVDDEYLNKIDTVADIVNYLEKNVEK